MGYSATCDDVISALRTVVSVEHCCGVAVYQWHSIEGPRVVMSHNDES